MGSMQVLNDLKRCICSGGSIATGKVELGLKSWQFNALAMIDGGDQVRSWGELPGICWNIDKGPTKMRHHYCYCVSEIWSFGCVTRTLGGQRRRELLET